MTGHPFLLSDAFLQGQRRRVFSLDVAGARYYVKTTNVKNFHFGHRLQGLAYRLTGNPLMIPTVFRDVPTAMKYEVKKLKRLREKQLPVPEVVYAEDRYFVTRDVGDPLHKVIKKHRDKGQEYALRAIKTLAKLHRTDTAHGGAQLKNFTLKNDKVHIIDFEENVEQAPLAEMQFRDILMFLLHLEGMGVAVDYKALTEAYESEVPYIIRARLRELAGRYRILKATELPLVRVLPMKDLRNFGRLLLQLEAI